MNDNWSMWSNFNWYIVITYFQGTILNFLFNKATLFVCYNDSICTPWAWFQISSSLFEVSKTLVTQTIRYCKIEISISGHYHHYLSSLSYFLCILFEGQMPVVSIDIIANSIGVKLFYGQTSTDYTIFDLRII